MKRNLPNPCGSVCFARRRIFSNLRKHKDTLAEIQNTLRAGTLASRECDATENMYNQSE